MIRLKSPSVTRELTLSSILLLALVAVSGCTGGPDESAGEDASVGSAARPGRLVIVGGALAADNAPVYQAVLEARQGDGPFCVIPTASGVPEESMATALDRFREHGADSVSGVWITTENPEAAEDPQVVAQLESCSGFWFVGGSQSRVIEVFRPSGRSTAVDQALHDRWQEGAVVSGSSAGAAMMPLRSIGGGSSAEAMEFGVTTVEDSPGVWVMDGMDFVPDALIGQHHLARGRWGRLVVAALEESTTDLAFGIDENTALVWEGGNARVIGASGVLLVDASAATTTGAREASGIRLELLGAGDEVELSSVNVTRAAGEGMLAGPASGPPAMELAPGPFERWALLHLLHRFATGEIAEIELDGGARRLHLTTGVGFSADASDRAGVQGTPHGLSVGPILLELRRNPG